MKPMEKLGWFVIAMVLIYAGAAALFFVGIDGGAAFGAVLTVFVAVMFAELMALIKK
jgi:hypothetical protein